MVSVCRQQEVADGRKTPKQSQNQRAESQMALSSHAMRGLESLKTGGKALDDALAPSVSLSRSASRIHLIAKHAFPRCSQKTISYQNYLLDDKSSRMGISVAPTVFSIEYIRVQLSNIKMRMHTSQFQHNMSIRSHGRRYQNDWIGCRMQLPVHSEAEAAAPSTQPLLNDDETPPEGLSHREHSYSSGRPAVAVVDNNADGAAAASDVVAQSHPAPHASQEQGMPRPALTVVMQEGTLSVCVMTMMQPLKTSDPC